MDDFKSFLRRIGIALLIACAIAMPLLAKDGQDGRIGIEAAWCEIDSPAAIRGAWGIVQSGEDSIDGVISSIQWSVGAGLLSIPQIEGVLREGYFAPYVEYFRAAGLVSQDFQVGGSTNAQGTTQGNATGIAVTESGVSEQTDSVGDAVRTIAETATENMEIGGSYIPTMNMVVYSEPDDKAEQISTIEVGSPVTVTAETSNGYLKLKTTVEGKEIAGYAMVEIENDEGEVVGVFVTEEEYANAWKEEEKIEPTCENEGKIIRINTLSGIKEEEIIPALGHNYEETSRTEPTCTEVGEIIYTCTIDGDVRTETIEALGHDDGEWVVAKDAGLFAKGLRELRCTRDGAVLDSEEIPQVVPIWATVLGCIVIAGAIVTTITILSIRKKKLNENA